MFLPFCFDVGFVFGMFYFVIAFALFLVLTMKNTVFHAILVYFYSCWLQGRFICFQFHVLVLVCFLCCLFPF